MIQPSIPFTATLVALTFVNLLSAADATFTPLGDLPGGAFSSSANAVSSDGSVVVGNATGASGREAFRWTQEEGMVGLGFLPGKEGSSFATDVSWDGSVIVGDSWDIEREAFIWTSGTGMLGLGDLPGGTFWSRATAVSSDGTVVAGIGEGSSGSRAVRWTAAEGIVELELPSSATFSQAWGISGDGNVVVGRVSGTLGLGSWEAVRWINNGSTSGLGDLSGGSTVSWLEASSFDGSVGAGSADDGLGRAIRWTAEDGLVPLLYPLGTDGGVYAHDIDADGQIIVGGGTTDGSGRAWIWDATNGVRLLQNLLTDVYGLGPSLEGWILQDAMGVSADGKWIVGVARNPSGDSEAFRVFLPDPYVLAPPVITLSPANQSVTAGTQISLTVGASGAGLSFQWQLNGVDIVGATKSTYTIPSVQRFHAGEYKVVVSNSAGSTISAGATVTVQNALSSNARLINLSTRGLSLIGDNVIIPGFVIEGPQSKRLLIRAVGPTLGMSPFNIDGVLSDPRMVLKRWNGSTFVDVAENDNWGDNANADEITQTAAELYAFGFNDEHESALLLNLPAGQYTVVTEGVDGGTGVCIVELYDADASTVDSRLINISTRGFVGVGAEVIIPGFVVSGDGPQTFLIRVVGPRLAQAPFNLNETMVDPQLELYQQQGGVGTLLFTQDNWSENPDAANTAATAASVYAFGLVEDSADAAFVVTLQPGIYTVVGSSADGVSTGMVVVEVYAVP